MRILLVEDEYSLADALMEALRSENYMVDLSMDGIDGLHQAMTGIYDLVILDVMLPEMDGFKVLKAMRKDRINTPVLILTAKADIDDKVEGLDLGADDYMTKPFHIRELLARVRAMSRRKGEVELEELTFGDLSLNKMKSQIKSVITAEEVNLGAKEFQLIEYLMSNSSQIVTREQIAEKIWGFDSEAEYNNVEVYISFLRKKLAFVGSGVKIKAVRGVGYTLEE